MMQQTRAFSAIVFGWVLMMPIAHGQTITQLQEALNNDNLPMVKTWLQGMGKTRLSPAQLYVRGQYQLRSGEPKAALKDLQTAAKAFPDNQDMWLSVAEAAGDAAGQAGMMSAGGLAKTARRALDTVVEINPQNVNAREGLIQFHLQAPWVMGGRTKEAYRQAEAITKIDSVLGRSWKARIDLAEGKPEAAEATFRSLLAQDPKQAGAAIGLATILQQKKQWREALDVLKPLAEDEPPTLIALYQIGRIGALSGQFLEPAELAMQRYLELAENDPQRPIPLSPAWWRMGMVLEHQARIADARAAFDKALQLDPDNDEAKKALKSLPKG